MRVDRSSSARLFITYFQRRSFIYYCYHWYFNGALAQTEKRGDQHSTLKDLNRSFEIPKDSASIIKMTQNHKSLFFHFQKSM